MDAFYAYFLTFLIIYGHYADNPMAALLYGVVVASLVRAVLRRRRRHVRPA